MFRDEFLVKKMILCNFLLRAFNLGTVSCMQSLTAYFFIVRHKSHSSCLLGLKKEEENTFTSKLLSNILIWQTRPSVEERRWNRTIHSFAKRNTAPVNLLDRHRVKHHIEIVTRKEITVKVVPRVRRFPNTSPVGKGRKKPFKKQENNKKERSVSPL